MKGWRENTKKQYKVYLEKWIRFCKRKNKNELNRNTCIVLEFLQHMFSNNYSYSAINTARSALSTIFDSPPIGEHNMIKRFMKGVFNTKPNLPRYTRIWDVSTVLNYLEKCSPGKCLDLSQLTQKLVTLIALISGQRSQTIHSLDLNHMEMTKIYAKFHIQDLLKHNSQYNKMTNIVTLPAYPDNKKLCAVTYLKQYIERTKTFRNQESKLFLSTQAPHKAVSTNTISRWIKLTLTKSGINTDIYKAHSTRAASTSAAASILDINQILKAASWTKAETFGRFYNKPIEDESTKFGLTVLQKK